MSKMIKKKDINIEVEFDISSLGVEDIVAWLEANYGKIDKNVGKTKESIDYEKDRMSKGLIDNLDFFIKEGNRKMAISTMFSLRGFPYSDCEKYVDEEISVFNLSKMPHFEENKNKTYIKDALSMGIFDLSVK